jgi:hypothetical protein
VVISNPRNVLKCVQLHQFKLEEICQLLWALASLNIPIDRSSALFSSSLAYWPSQIQDSLASTTGRATTPGSPPQSISSHNNSHDAATGQHTRGERSTTEVTRSPHRVHLKPKNVVQLAFAYAKVDDQFVPEAAKDSRVDEDIAVAFKLVRASHDPFLYPSRIAAFWYSICFRTNAAAFT